MLKGLSERAIALSLGLGKGTVGGYLARARQAGLSWPLLTELDDDSLELLLFPSPTMASRIDRPVPDWSAMDVELRRPGVTRALLWDEYRAQAADGFGYAWFCEHFDAWKGRVRPTSHRRCAQRRTGRCAFSATRQTHVGGEKVFVDFAGDTIDVIDPVTGEARAMKLCVAASRRRRASGTTGASNYTYAEAVPSEGLEDWALAHVRMFAFLGGVPKAVVANFSRSDNLKAAVIKADRFDPGLNRTYAEMAAHYGTAILPARPRKPRDKAKVEVAVQVAHRWMSQSKTRLRHGGKAAEPSVLLFGGAERGDPAASGRVEHARHARLWCQPCGSVCHFGPAQPADPAARSLCLRPPDLTLGQRARVAPDYHVEVDSSWYSVAFALIKPEVDVRVARQTVEIFHRGQRVASHARPPMFSQTGTSIRSILKTGPHSNRSGPSFSGRLPRGHPPPARQHSWWRLFPLRKDQNADPSHP